MNTQCTHPTAYATDLTDADAGVSSEKGQPTYVAERAGTTQLYHGAVQRAGAVARRARQCRWNGAVVDRAVRFVGLAPFVSMYQ